MINTNPTGALKDKIALVTGASRGIGFAVASSLTKAGAYVIGTATTNKGAQKITTALVGKGRGIVLDVTDSVNADKTIKKIIKEERALHILVNNAGITKDNLLVRMKEQEWDDVILTNLTGTFRLCKLSLKTMMKQRFGRIINIASVVALTGNPGQTNYAASKTGLIGFSKSLAREVGSRNITVNVIAPGFINTDMTDMLSSDQKEKMLNNIPLQRFGEAEEIGDSVVFLASDYASYITGETLNVNGGMYMN
mgnify:CR=1 FL=1